MVISVNVFIMAVLADSAVALEEHLNRTCLSLSCVALCAGGATKHVCVLLFSTCHTKRNQKSSVAFTLIMFKFPHIKRKITSNVSL